MKHGLKSFAVLALCSSLLPASSAFANISCSNMLESLNLNDKDPAAVEVSLGLGRGALNFKGEQMLSDGLTLLSSVTYKLESQYGESATLKVSTTYPDLHVYGCGRRICSPENGEKPSPQVPTSPKISAVLEVGSENPATYDFKQCYKDEMP